MPIFVFLFVQVYDLLDNGVQRLMDTFCHNQVPSALTSSSNNMKVVFQSDADTNGNGFSASFTAGKKASFFTNATFF